MPIQFNQITKGLITSLIVAPAYASFVGRNSMKGKDKGKDAFDGSIERSLYYAYHGDPEKDVASHAMMFCSMKGNIFSKLIEKDYATAETLICTEGDIHQDASKQAVERVNLDMFLRMNDCIVLDKTFAIGILRPTLQATKKTPNATIQPRSLKNTFEKDVCAVKKLIVVQNGFLDSNGDLPSGKTVDDLVAYIWAECWKQHSFETCKKNSNKKTLNPCDSSDDEDDNDDDDTEGRDVRNSNAESIVSTVIPDDFIAPAMKLNGKWMPKGWPVFVAYVCHHTRCCDDLVHFYVGEGPWLDQSKAQSRKREREDNKSSCSKGNTKMKLKYSYSGGQDTDGNMTLEQKQVSIQLAQAQSKDKYAHVSGKVIQRQMEVSTLQQQQMDLWNMMMAMYDNNIATMKLSDEWKEFDTIRIDLRDARRQHKAATEELNEFERNDSFGEASRRMLSQIGMANALHTNDAINDKGSYTPISAGKPSTVCIVRAEAATPMSQLSNLSTFPTGVCCAGEDLCKEPLMELRENHVCKTCHGIVHMLCVGIPVHDPDDDVICKKCYVSKQGDF